MSRKDPAWRDRAASDLLAKHLPGLAPEGPALVIEDPLPDAEGAFSDLGLETAAWHRRALGGRPAAPWPPDGPFGTAAIRLPRAKEELDMAVHAAAGALAPGGRLLVYGARDEGAGSAARCVEPLFGPVRTVATGGRCRLLEATRPATLAGLRGTLADWRTTFPVDLGAGPVPWSTYPGVFASGRIDEGTALLLGVLADEDLPEGGRALDFGCGSGLVGGALRVRRPDVRVELLDVDAVALEAARENVPGAALRLSDGLPEGAGHAPWDLVVANPPYHAGKAESLRVVEALVAGAPRVLAPEGRLVLVVQRRLPVEPSLRRAFRRVGAAADDGAFRVWRARGPKR